MDLDAMFIKFGKRLDAVEAALVDVQKLAAQLPPMMQEAVALIEELKTLQAGQPQAQGNQAPPELPPNT